MTIQIPLEQVGDVQPGDTISANGYDWKVIAIRGDWVDLEWLG